MKKKRFLLFVIIIILVFVWLIWDNYRISVSNYSVQDDSLPEAFDGFTIVLVSDLHNASFGKEQNRLIEKIQAEKPDMIAITGDLIDSNHTDIDVAMQFVIEAKEIAPIYYVTGNHEAWVNEYETVIKPQLIENDVMILEDTSVFLEREGQHITVVGLDDPAMELKGDVFGETEAMVDTKLERLKGRGFSILLSHRPELISVYAAHSISLVLSGHAHGGQIRIPFIGGICAPNQGWFPKYTAGVYQEENTKMIVSRGLGNSVIPVRVNDCPEVVVVTLKK